MPRAQRAQRRILTKRRDKLPTRTRRHTTWTYSCPVSRTIRDVDQFQRWVQRVLDHLEKDRGWGITRAAKEAGTPRSAVSRWRDGDWSQGKPTKASVLRFCENLGIPVDEPFAMFGWDPSGPGRVEPVPLPTVDDEDLLAVQDILRRRNISDDEVFEIRAVLRMVRRQHEDDASGAPEDASDDRAAG